MEYYNVTNVLNIKFRNLKPIFPTKIESIVNELDAIKITSLFTRVKTVRNSLNSKSASVIKC